jgi:pimeloyl-ACP methyl ester carboxylesterase
MIAHRIVVASLLFLAPIARAASTTQAVDPFKVEVTGHGPPMILIPGLGCSGEVWQETAAHFQDRYECHVLTLAGFAGQKAIDAPILSNERDAILRYIREKKLNKPVIVGHSLGAILAYAMASTEPEAIGPIVAVDGVPYMPALLDPAATPETMRARADQFRKMMKNLPPGRMQVQNAMTLQRMITKPTDIERACKWMDASDQNTLAEAFYEVFATDLRESAAKIKSPVLLLAAGADDQDPEARKVLEQSYRQQVARIPNAQVVVAEKAKHFIMMDDPEFLFRQMETFLQSAK